MNATTAPAGQSEAFPPAHSRKKRLQPVCRGLVEARLPSCAFLRLYPLYPRIVSSRNFSASAFQSPLWDWTIASSRANIGFVLPC